jgi:peptidoglycan/LPS O-acetylase OafA/YrhL
MAEVDGLRFIAIFSVMLFHVYFNVAHSRDIQLAPGKFDFLAWPITNGFRGVQLFFVISGFILGLPFAAHYITGGPPVKIGRFYLRRITRLEPPYILALLLVYAAAVLMHNVHTKEPGFFSGLPLRLAYSYYFIRLAPSTLDGVTWTLEIEVQFYLLAPLLAKVFKLPAVPRRLALIVAIIGVPFLTLIVPRGEHTLLGFVQYFLIGFLMADFHCTNAGKGWLPAWLLDLAGVGCLLTMLFMPETPLVLNLLPWVLGGIFIAALRGNLFTAFLRLPTISVIGGMCYSLYLLHNPILSFITNKVVVNGMSVPLAYFRLLIIGMPPVMIAGIVYYILIERPCMVPNWPRLAFHYFSRKMSGTSQAASPIPDSSVK